MKYLVILIAFISTFATAQVTDGKFNSIQGDRTQTQSTLKITSPKEGDTLTNSKEIVITWEGIDPNTPVDIDCSYISDTYNWVPVARGVTGTSFKYELQKYGYHQMYLTVPVYYNNIYFRIKQSDPNFKKNRDVIKSFNYEGYMPFLSYKDKIIGFDNCTKCNYNQTIRIWNAKTGLNEATLEYPGKDFWGAGRGNAFAPNNNSAFSISPDGSKLMAQSFTNRYNYDLRSIFVWDLNNYKLINTLTVKSKFAVFSLDSKSIICIDQVFSGNDTLSRYSFPIYVKNINTGLIENRFTNKTEGGFVLGIKRIGDKLLVLIENKTHDKYYYEVWDMNDYKYLYTIENFGFPVDLFYQHYEGFELESTTDYSSKYLLQQNGKVLRFLDLNTRNDTFLIAKSYDILNELSFMNIKSIPYTFDITISSDLSKWAFYINGKVYVVDISNKKVLFEKEYSYNSNCNLSIKFIDFDTKLLTTTYSFGDKLNVNILYDISNKTEQFIGGQSEEYYRIVSSSLGDTLIYLKNINYLYNENEIIYWNSQNNALIGYNPFNFYINKNQNDEDIYKYNIIGRNRKRNILVTCDIIDPMNWNANKFYFVDLLNKKIIDSLQTDTIRILYSNSEDEGNAKLDSKNNLFYILQVKREKDTSIVLTIYNSTSKKLINNLFIDKISNYNTKFTDFAYSDNGKQIAVRYGDSLFKVFDIYSGNLVKEIVAKDSIQISTFQFTNEGNYLLLTSHEGEISFYEISSDNKTSWYQNPFNLYIKQALLSNDDRKIFTLDDYGVNVWNTDNGELLRSINPMYGIIYTMSINDDGSKLYVGERDGTIVKYNITDTKYEQTMPLHTYLSYPTDSLVFDDSTSVPTNNDKPLVMSPNPSSDKIDIAYTFDEEGGTASLYVYNVFGQVILSKEIPKTKTGKYTLNLKELPIGQYVVKISSPNSIQTQNFQIMR